MNNTTTILNKVVFIDDNPLTNELHKVLSKSMGLASEVECYETAEEVLDIYTSEEADRAFPSVFFVDIGLPQMDGHELGVKLSRLPGFNEGGSKVCFLTASKDIRDVVKADSNEFEHYFWKPMDKRKMTQFLREAFRINLDEQE